MLGKRSRSSHKTLSAVAMALECTPGECFPPWKITGENNKLIGCHPAPPIQVIGFHPKVSCGKGDIDEEKHLEQCGIGANVSHKSVRRTSGLDRLLYNSTPSPGKQNLSAQTVGLGIVAALHTNSSQQNQPDRNVSISGGCSSLRHSAFIRADTCPSDKQNVITVDRPVASKAIRTSPPHFQQPLSICQFAGKSSHLLDLLDEQNPSGSTAEEMESSNFLEKGAGADTISKRCVFTSLASSTSPTYTAESACLETMDFMGACFLCKRVLENGRDIFMYRGDKAFCSAECRHEQIVLDERTERRQKCAALAFRAANGAQPQRRIHRNRLLSPGTAAAA